MGDLLFFDFIFELVKDGGDGVHWSSGFNGGFDLSHDGHDGSSGFEGKSVFFQHGVA